MDYFGSGGLLRAFPSVLQRKNRRRDHFARPPYFPGVPVGQGVALRSAGGLACAARTCRRGRIHTGLEALWRLGRFWGDAGLFTGDISGRGSSRTDALSRDPFLGVALPG